MPPVGVGIAAAVRVSDAVISGASVDVLPIVGIAVRVSTAVGWATGVQATNSNRKKGSFFIGSPR